MQKNLCACLCIHTVCESGSSYSSARGARWAKWSFITLEKHSTVHFKQILVNICTKTSFHTKHAQQSNRQEKHSWHNKQHEQMHMQCRATVHRPPLLYKNLTMHQTLQTTLGRFTDLLKLNLVVFSVNQQLQLHINRTKKVNWEDQLQQRYCLTSEETYVYRLYMYISVLRQMFCILLQLHTSMNILKAKTGIL